jgi:hypothetical protein
MYPDLSRPEAISIFSHEHPDFDLSDYLFYFSNTIVDGNFWRYEIPLTSVTSGCNEYIELLAYNNRDGELYNLKVPTKFLIDHLDGPGVQKSEGNIVIELSGKSNNWLGHTLSGGRNLDFSMFMVQPGDGYKFDRLLHKRIIQAVRTQKDRSELYDPIEDEPLLRPIFAEVAAEIERSDPDTDFRKGMGHCFIVWQAQARILLERFGVVWYSPSQMNPGALFD